MFPLSSPLQAEYDSAKVVYEEEKKRRPTPSKVMELLRSSDLSSEWPHRRQAGRLNCCVLSQHFELMAPGRRPGNECPPCP